MRRASSWCGLVILAILAACGHDGALVPGDAGLGGLALLDAGLFDGGQRTDADAGNPPLTDAGRDAGATALDAGPAVPLEGVWQVAGSDGFGAYQGQVEIVADPDAGADDYTRVVQYPGVTVEDGGALWWVWQGTLSQSGSALAASVPLQVADFISQRGALTRTAADQAPVIVTGTLTKAATSVVGSYSGTGIAANETWTHWAPSGPSPIFALDVSSVALNGPIDPTTKAALWAGFATFFALPTVAPYVNDPAFQAAIHSEILDHTDYDFYQANPGAIRVVDKVIDPISTQETLLRASAFKWTLASKAAFIDQDIVSNFIDPVTGLVDDQNGSEVEDGSLWTGCYVASQAFRYWVSGDARALTNIETSLVGLLTIFEITGDPTQFARELRPAQPSNETGGWTQGTGQFAAIDWLTGGNNDCLKGVVYGLATGYAAVCDPVQPGQQALCARIQADVATLADKLTIAQPPTTGSVAGNGARNTGNPILTQWLAAYVVGSLKYQIGLETQWNLRATITAQADLAQKEIITADWSGNNLEFLQIASQYFLNTKVSPIGFSPKADLIQGIDTMQGMFQDFRLGLWDVFFAALATTPGPTVADDARWRLRETCAPKPAAIIDHRVSASFVMSPFPTDPWYTDWTHTDRTQSLVGYPSYEQFIEDYSWKSSPFAYLQNTAAGREPQADYLLAYWLGRHLGVFSATE